MNGSSPRIWRCIVHADPDPRAFFDLQFCIACVYEAPLACGMLAPQVAVASEGRPAVATYLDHGDPVEDTPTILSASV